MSGFRTLQYYLAQYISNKMILRSCTFSSYLQLPQIELHTVWSLVTDGKTSLAWF